MSKTQNLSPYRKKVKKVELALRRKKTCLRDTGVALGYTICQVYAATRDPEPQHGNRYEIAVKLGILEPTTEG